jgi:hypothetical protein
MTQPPWETIEVPQGSFIGWGDHAGQYVMGKVISYDATGGTDFNQQVCPRLDVELHEPAASFTKEGTRSDYPAGAFVALNCGLANLKRSIIAAQLNIGDLVKITLTSFEKVDRGTVKIFEVKVARGAGGPVGQTQQPAQGAQQFGQPPAGPPPSQPPAGQQFGQPAPGPSTTQPQQFGQAPAPAQQPPPADPWGAAPAQPAGSEPPF